MTADPLVTAFERLVESSPGRPLALRGDRVARVADVAALARAAGRALDAAGTPAPGEPIGLQAANGTGALAALLALRRRGAAALLIDPQIPDRERDRAGGQIGARRVLRCAGAWPLATADFEVLRLPTAPAAPTALSELDPRIAVIKLTSGSTGTARGIATASDSLLADERQLFSTMGLRVDDRLLAAIPFSHSYGLSSLVLPALVRGMTLVLPATEDPFAPLQAAAAHRATVFPTVPAYLGALTRLAEPPALAASLRLVLTAGAPLSTETSRRFRQLFGLPVHVFYGSSESGGICYDRQGGAAERGTVGAPVDGVTVELADDGRVTVRSAAVAAGYVPAAPAASGRLAGGRFVTDDLGDWRDGELALGGRVNELINVHGRKVNPREVERVLEALDAVDEALVTAVKVGEAATADGAGEQQVRAFVACPAGALSAREIVAHCRRHLADYKTPRSVVLVAALPRTARGKIDRVALAALLPSAPDRSQPATAATGRRRG